jgi:hypothetical protein
MDHSQHRTLNSVLLVLSACTLSGASLVAAQTALAPVPPAKSVIVGASSTAAAKAAAPNGGVTPAPKLAYSEVSPGLLARTVFATKDAGPVEIEFVDILVGPKQSVKLAAAEYAELLEIETGAPSLSVDGVPVAFQSTRFVGIDQGRAITIDNREERAVVARLIKLKGLGK